MSKSWFVVCLSLFLSGCATILISALLPPTEDGSNHAYVTFADESFTHAKIWQGKIILGGVSSTQEAWTMAHMTSLTHIATEAMREKKHFIFTQPFDVLLQALGQEEVYRLNQSIRTNAKLSDEELAGLSAQFKEKLPYMRYILFSFVIADSEYEDHNARNEYKQSRLEETYHDYISSRSMKVAALVYDLEEKKLVWSAVSQLRLYRSNSRETHTDDSFEEDLRDDFILGTSPEIPTDEEMMQVAYELYLTVLPKPCAAIMSKKDCKALKASMTW